MKFQTEWINDANNAVPEERSTVASLRIHVGEVNAAVQVEGGVTTEGLTVSVYGLADGFAREWWRIFGSRGGPATIRRYRDGYVLPDVRLEFDGRQMRVWSAPLTLENPPVRFQGCPPVYVARPEVEQELTGFVGAVLERLEAQGLQSTSLEQCWRRLLSSRDDPEEASFCEAAGALHLDPYSISDADADFVMRAAKEFSGEALLEFLSAVRGVDRSRMKATLEVISSIKENETRLCDLRRIALETDNSGRRHSDGRPWSLGYQKAARLRRVLSHSGPPPPELLASDIAEMAAWFGASPDKYKAEKSLVGLLALRRDVGDDVHVAIRESGSDGNPGQRFAFTRAVGDAICFPQGGSAPVNELDNAYRQAAGRAFAAEFLAPLGSLEEMSADGMDVYEIADCLRVSPEVVTRQLGNASNIRAAQAA